MLLNMMIHRVFHAQKNRIRPQMAQIGLSPGQPKILSHVYAHEGCIQREIADALDIEAATVSKILNNMVREGLVERGAAGRRRRAAAIALTEKGRQYYAKWSDICASYEQTALRGFSEAEKERLADYLGRIYANVRGKALADGPGRREDGKGAME